MVSLSDKWNILKNGDALSQKFMGKVKPEAPLKIEQIQPKKNYNYKFPGQEKLIPN